MRRAKVVYSPVSAFVMDSSMPRNLTILSGGVDAIVPEGNAVLYIFFSLLIITLMFCFILGCLGTMTDSKPAVDFRAGDF